MTKVMPTSCCRRFSSSCIAPRSFLSSAPSGSSSSSSARPLDQRARERDALLLAARQLIRLAVGEVRRAAVVARIASTRARISSRRQALHLQPVGDVGAHAHMREQRVGLEHQVDRPLVRRQRRDVAAVEQDAPVARRLEAGEHAQQRGLAAAGRAEQREELVLADVERDAVDRGRPRRNVLRRLSMASSVRGCASWREHPAVEPLRQGQRGDR